LVGFYSRLGWAKKALFKEKKYLDHVIQLGGESLNLHMTISKLDESKHLFPKSDFVTSNFSIVTNQLELLGGIGT